MKVKMEKFKKFFSYLILILAVGIWSIPIIWVIMTSIKPRKAIFTVVPRLTFQPTFEHFVRAITTYGILDSLLNSFIVTLSAVAITLVVSVPAGYAYSRVDFRGSEASSFYILFTQMVPPIGVLLPFYYIAGKLGLLDTYIILIATYLTITIPISVWLMITYFRDVPHELEEAARIDGASRFTAFYKIILPQVQGGIAVTAIFAFITAWNEFLFASTLTGSRTQTVPVAVFSFLTGEESLWGPFAATGVMVMIPAIFLVLFAQERLVKGLTFGIGK